MQSGTLTVLTGEGLRLRSNHSTQATILAVLAAATYPVTGEELTTAYNGWIWGHVVVNGQEGYVALRSEVGTQTLAILTISEPDDPPEPPPVDDDPPDDGVPKDLREQITYLLAAQIQTMEHWHQFMTGLTAILEANLTATRQFHDEFKAWVESQQSEGNQ